MYSDVKPIHLQRINPDMSTNSTKINQIEAQIVQGLQSEDDSAVLKAIKKARSKGTEKVIPAMFEVYANSKNSSVKEAVTKLLQELKSTSAIDPLIDQLSSPHENCRILALSAIWNSGLNVNDYIDEIVQTVNNGDFQEAFEALTIIENLEPPFDEEVILNSQLMLNQYFNKNTPAEKDSLVKEIASIINRIGQQI